MSFSAHPIDLTIFFIFLIITLTVGLSYGREIKTIRDYALGGKNFSTSTLVATIIATFHGGGTLFRGIEKTYSIGLYYNLPLVGISIGLFLSGQLASRMKEFMNNLSVAEAMGDMYGKTARIITAISGSMAKLGAIAIQFKVMSRILVLLFGFESAWATIVAAGITILYSASGGIRAVTFTDVIQFFTFGAIIPLLALVIWSRLQDTTQIVTTLANNPMFNLKQVVGWHPEFLSSLGLLLYFAIPGFTPDLFQRIAMAKNVKQAQSALTYSAGMALLVSFFVSWVGILLLVDNPGLEANQVVAHMIEKYTYPGFKALIGIGVTALTMSTADSCLNAASILFANDIVKPLSRQAVGSIKVARSFSVVGGIIALLLSLYSDDLLALMLLSGSFYMPIFTVPMLMAVLGFRTTTKGVLRGMLAGFSTVVLWSLFFNNSDSIIPGMLANLIVLLATHYLLGEPGGWQKVAPDSPLGLERAARKEAWQRRLQAIKNFKLYSYLQQNLPEQEGLYSLFAFYTIAATYTGFYTIGDSDMPAHREIYEGIYHTVLFATTAFLTFPIWPPKIKSYRFITFFWPLGMGAILFFAGTLLAIISDFHTMQMMVLMINLLIAVLLLQWYLALVLAVGGGGLAIWFFQYYTGQPLPGSGSAALQANMLYGLLLLASLLIVLFRGKRAYGQLGEKNRALQSRDEDHQAHILQLAAEKQAALHALQHTGVEELLTIAHELQTIQVAKKDTERMQALRAKLFPMAFQLQSIDARALDYLRLNIVQDYPIDQLMSTVQEQLREKGITQRVNYYKHTVQHATVTGDPEQLTTLLTQSIRTLAVQVEAQYEKEETSTIILALEDTELSYPLPDVAKDYSKQVQALRITVTAAEQLPPLAPSYQPDLSSSTNQAHETSQELQQQELQRIIKSHYGYAEVNDETMCYIIPVDLQEVRPQDMDKDYMELGAMPKRANDHYQNKKKGIDAQIQEQEFFAAVGARSKADLGLIKEGLELIKWYHGSSTRKSGEPFYLHPLAVAQIVLDYDTAQETIIGALLHDTVEDTQMLLQHIADAFGQETAEIVDVVTHLQSIPGSIYKVKLSAVENLQMLKKAGNKRALYVKLADRMHNMRTIKGHKKPAKRRLIAQETLDFFVPMAEQLGLQQAAQEFKELCEEVLKK